MSQRNSGDALSFLFLDARKARIFSTNSFRGRNWGFSGWVGPVINLKTFDWMNRALQKRAHIKNNGQQEHTLRTSFSKLTCVRESVGPEFSIDIFGFSETFHSLKMICNKCFATMHTHTFLIMNENVVAFVFGNFRNILIFFHSYFCVRPMSSEWLAKQKSVGSEAQFILNISHFHWTEVHLIEILMLKASKQKEKRASKQKKKRMADPTTSSHSERMFDCDVQFVTYLNTRCVVVAFSWCVEKCLFVRSFSNWSRSKSANDLALWMARLKSQWGKKYPNWFRCVKSNNNNNNISHHFNVWLSLCLCWECRIGVWVLVAVHLTVAPSVCVYWELKVFMLGNLLAILCQF